MDITEEEIKEVIVKTLNEECCYDDGNNLSEPLGKRLAQAIMPVLKKEPVSPLPYRQICEIFLKKKCQQNELISVKILMKLLNQPEKLLEVFETVEYFELSDGEIIIWDKDITKRQKQQCLWWKLLLKQEKWEDIIKLYQIFNSQCYAIDIHPFTIDLIKTHRMDLYERLSLARMPNDAMLFGCFLAMFGSLEQYKVWEHEVPDPVAANAQLANLGPSVRNQLPVIPKSKRIWDSCYCVSTDHLSWAIYGENIPLVRYLLTQNPKHFKLNKQGDPIVVEKLPIPEILDLLWNNEEYGQQIIKSMSEDEYLRRQGRQSSETTDQISMIEQDPTLIDEMSPKDLEDLRTKLLAQ